MKFVKQNFMGIELDVLIGHPDHDLLFVATQVARAAGLKDPKGTVRQYAPKASAGVLRVSDVLGDNLSSMRPEGIHAPTWAKMYLFTEATMYDMLLRGHAPQSEPFRKWVTEEVLPSETEHWPVLPVVGPNKQGLRWLFDEAIGLYHQMIGFVPASGCHCDLKVAQPATLGYCSVSLWPLNGAIDVPLREICEASLGQPCAFHVGAPSSEGL